MALKQTNDLIKKYGKKLKSGSMPDADLVELLNFKFNKSQGYVDPNAPKTETNHSEWDAILDFVGKVAPMLSAEQLHQLTGQLITNAPQGDLNTFMRRSTLEKAFLAYEMAYFPQQAERHFELERILNEFQGQMDITNLKTVILKPGIEYFQSELYKSQLAIESNINKNKWVGFHSKYSPVDVTRPLVSDELSPELDREAKGQNRMKINGKFLSDYAKDYNHFKTEDNVKKFYSDAILKNVTNTQDKNQMVEFLMKSFHQSGLMMPVTSALKQHLGNRKTKDLAIAGDPIQSINIVTTSKGFKVQEFVEVAEMCNPLLLPQCDNSGNSIKELITPDAGKDYVISAQATLDIDFTTNPKQPNITVESNTISYGSSYVESEIDNRSLGQMLVDWLIRLFGGNKVKDISPDTPTSQSVGPNLSDEPARRPGGP